MLIYFICFLLLIILILIYLFYRDIKLGINVLKYLPYDNRTIILKKQRERLLEIINYSCNNINLYKHKYQNINFNNEIKLSDLPIVTKNEIINNFNSSHINSNDTIKIVSSGTTGVKVTILNNYDTWLNMFGILFSRIMYNYINLFCYSPKIKVSMIIADNGPHVLKKISEPFTLLSKIFLEVNIIPITSTIEEMTEKLEKSNPDIIFSYPSALSLILNNKDIKINPKIIIFGSEKLDKNLSKLCKNKFKSVIINTYASTECLFMASSCHLGKLHINEDLCIIEPIDKNGNIIMEGASDSILLTNLVNYQQPLIRYKITDSVKFINCHCGSKYQALKIYGRSDDNIIIKDDNGIEKVHLSIAIQSIMLGISNINQFQFIQVKNKIFHIIVHTNVSIDLFNIIKQNIKSKLKKYFKQNNITAKFKILFNCDIIRNKGHKYQQILSLIK